jgi:CRISPR system Cascade subunit CasD
LTEIRDKLLEPDFVLYLGRKSCPLALPLQPALKSADSIEDALAGIDLNKILLALWGDKTGERLNDKFSRDGCCLAWDADAKTRISQDQIEILTRRDTSLSRRRWQFAVREERRASWPAGGEP